MRPGFVVVVRTFNRPVAVRTLIEDLVRETPPNVPLKVAVFDDASGFDNAAAKQLCAEQRWAWVRHPSNHGKRRAWQAFNAMFHWVKVHAHPMDLVVFLDDDMRLCRDFFARVATAWRSIRDRRKSTMHLMVDCQRQGATCWTAYEPKRHNEHVSIIQWVDGAFVADYSFFRTLAWRLQPIGVSRWAHNPNLSTGVGRQVSQRLVSAGRKLFQVNRSLVVHTQIASRMNPGLRNEQRLETVDFVDGEQERDRLSAVATPHIEASLASIPERHKQLNAVLTAMRPQVDVLRVYLNRYKGTPGWVRRLADEVVHSDDEGDRGDAGKFYWCEQAKGIQLTLDDDIHYPSSYADAMAAAVLRYERRAAVGIHGVVLREPMLSYYADRQSLHFAAELPDDQPVHVLGTGCLAYDADALPLERADFELPNMADVWFALKAQEHEVPLVALARPKDWLRPLPTAGQTIYDTHRHDDHPQTEAVRRRWPFKLHHPPSR
jgi:glycosyltransferase involved in cell wall biosynthesis